MNQVMPGNMYLPKIAVITDVIVENPQIKTFVLTFADPEENRAFSYAPGQFMMVSLPHQGEAPISLASTPTRPGSIHLSVRKAGKLTGRLHCLKPGDVVGLRGPYGRPFPLEELKGRDLVFVAGGIGLAPLRSVINFCLDQGADYGRKIILYGSRSPSDIAFKEDLLAWRQRRDVTCLLTVDEADAAWTEGVGVVTTLLEKIEIEAARTTALVCGPPIMIRFVLAALVRLGLSDEQIITTMERHMKCGVGVCGHCHMDGKLVCIDGPVFNRAQLKNMDVMELSS